MLNRRSVLLSALTSMLAASPAFARSSFSNAAFAAATNSGRPVLVEFHADWCPTCRAQEKVVSALVAKPDFNDVIVLRVLFDSQKELLKRFRVRQQSTLIMFKSGSEMARAVGITSSSAIENLIKTAN